MIMSSNLAVVKQLGVCSSSGTAPQPPARQGSAATVTTGARLGSIGTAVRQESVTAVPAAQPSAASYPWSLPPQGSLNKAQGSGQLPARIGPGFSTSREHSHASLNFTAGQINCRMHFSLLTR